MSVVARTRANEDENGDDDDDDGYGVKDGEENQGKQVGYSGLWCINSSVSSEAEPGLNGSGYKKY